MGQGARRRGRAAGRAGLLEERVDHGGEARRVFVGRASAALEDLEAAPELAGEPSSLLHRREAVVAAYDRIWLPKAPILAQLRAVGRTI